ncbi:nuclear transport factor 2 family protein [uncultured Tateyamaria sp.]|uniref:nuclear transport factor 2 family protein n=1 Tax=uncultured Tateyamaria sp. TaxID=455651 RepID=UPI00261F9303|nr:nuclear transport factor 2 family protein [uncultured Tateyamaria sp.]
MWRGLPFKLAHCMTLELQPIFDAWGEPDAATRAALVTPALNENFYYADPHAPHPYQGVSAFLDFLTVFAERVPDAAAKIVATSRHNTHARVTLDLTRDGAPMARVQYFIDHDINGKLTRMVGFMGTEDTA